MKRRFPLVCIAMLAGCAGPRPQVPSNSIFNPPPSWRGDGVTSGAVASDWWKAFGNPVLTQIVQDALANSDDVAIAAERVEQARAQFRLAEAQRRPDVDGGGEGGRKRDVNPGFGVPEAQNLGSGVVNATWDLDLFGRLRDVSRSARASLLASQDGQDAVRLAVVSSAAKGYINLRALDARLIVVQRTFEARANALKVARHRVEAGYSPQLDLRQAEASFYAAEQLVPATELAIRLQENGLSLLLGRTSGEIPRGKDVDENDPPTVPAGLPASLLRRRPDVAAAEQQLVAADRTLDSVRASFMPNLQLSGQGGAVVSSLITQNPTGTYTLAASILGPILDAGRLRAEQQGAAARRNQAAYSYRKTAIMAFRDVEDALANVQRSADQQIALVKERDALAATLILAAGRYRSGYSPYLEQIDAERALLSSELSLVQSRADRLSAAVGLYQALGGGWSVPK